MCDIHSIRKNQLEKKSSTEKRKRDQPTGMKPFPRKTKQKQFDVNGLMVIHFCVVFVFEFSNAMQNTFAYCIREEFDRNAERKKRVHRRAPWDIWCEHATDDKQEFMHTSGVDVAKELAAKT